MKVLSRVLLAVAPLAAAGPVLADDLAGVATPVAWVAAPTRAQVAAAYPAAARAKGVGGKALLTCQFARTGAVTACQAADETPNGLGFGAAARSLAPLFRGPTVDASGRPLVRTPVQIVVNFTPDLLDPAKTGGGRASWISMPTPAAFQAGFPASASTAGVLKARVVIACTVQPDGGLKDCSVDSEDPGGYGFGQAALGIAPSFRASAWGEDGRPVIGATIKTLIRYELTQAPAN